MSVNLRLLNQTKQSVDNVVAQIEELQKPLAPFYARVKVLEKLNEAATKQKPFRYSLLELEDDLLKKCVTAITEHYKTVHKAETAKDLPKVVFIFIKAVYSTITDRIENVNSCTNPESVKEWRIDNLAGLETEKESVRDSWQNPQSFPSLYKGRVRGILFYGPPGTGKTVLAKAMSNSLPGVAFYSVDGASLKSKWHGETEKKIAGKFNCASDAVESGKYSAAIVFLDEIDSVGGRRPEDGGGSSGSTTPALLTAMDGFFSSDSVAVVGATNVPWQLDGGLIRRFDERVLVDLPTIRARIGIILDAIVKQFLPPWIKVKAEHGWIGNNVPQELEKMLDTSVFTAASQETWGAIDKYVYDTDSNPTYRNVEAPSKPETPITNKNIAKALVNIAQLLGPQPGAKDIMKSRATRPEEFYAKAPSLYGFNASDIATVVRKAANIAARKLFAKQYSVTWAPITAPDGQRYAVARFYNPEDQMDSFAPVLLPTAIEQVGANRLLNFTITEEDFALAISQVGSSVSAKDYQRILEWKNTGQ